MKTRSASPVAALLCLGVLAACVGDGASKGRPLEGFVHQAGTKLIDGRGERLYLRGVNLGNWLVWEGYLMMGDFNFRTHSQLFSSLRTALGSHEAALEFERQWRLNYVDERAIEELAALGFNSVRVPFHHNLFWQRGALRDDGFEYLDRLIESCRKHNIYVLLDMHGAPGFQNPGDHSDNWTSNASQPRGSVRFWDGDNVDIAANVWRHIAAHYSEEPVVLGYDLINEPVPQDGREYELLPSYVKIRNAIREVDQNHTLVVEGSWWGSELRVLDWTNKAVREKTGITAPWDENLTYELHHYGPVAAAAGREAITNALGVPLLLGEYGETDEDNLRSTARWARSALSGDFPWSFKKMSHDRALWTIPPNGSYEKVKQFIRDGGAPPVELADDMIGFATNNVRNGDPNLVWHESFYEAIAPR